VGGRSFPLSQGKLSVGDVKPSPSRQFVLKFIFLIKRG
jgi:hypothetical protein